MFENRCTFFGLRNVYIQEPYKTPWIQLPFALSASYEPFCEDIVNRKHGDPAGYLRVSLTSYYYSDLAKLLGLPQVHSADGLRDVLDIEPTGRIPGRPVALRIQAGAVAEFGNDKVTAFFYKAVCLYPLDGLMQFEVGKITQIDLTFHCFESSWDEEGHFLEKPLVGRLEIPTLAALAPPPTPPSAILAP